MNFLTHDEWQEIQDIKLPIQNIRTQVEDHIWFTTYGLFNTDKEERHDTLDECLEEMKHFFLPLLQACNAIMARGTTHASIASPPTFASVQQDMHLLLQREVGDCEELGDIYRKCITIGIRHALTEVFLMTRSVEQFDHLAERMQRSDLYHLGSDELYDPYKEQREQNWQSLQETHGPEIFSDPIREQWREFAGKLPPYLTASLQMAIATDIEL